MSPNEQIILAVDSEGNFTGEYIPKPIGHTGIGKRHLAIAVLLYNSKGQVLLQNRKHAIFDDIWDVTGATHPLHKEDGSDETLEEATLRCLKREYGIKENLKLKNCGMFNYYAKYGELCENEHCACIVGEYNGKINPNTETSYGCKWINKSKFLQDIYANPKKYSPWAAEAVKILKKTSFFTG